MKDFRPDLNKGDDDNNANGNGGAGGGIPMPFSMMPMGPDEGDIENILINMNEESKNMEPIRFRDREVRQTLSALTRMQKSNCILVGAAGTGKTAIAEEIARLIANGDPVVPGCLKDFTLYGLPLANIVAGCGIVGELEEKVQSIIEFFEDPDNKAIMFMDEIHQLADEHNPINQKVAQILKPALSRGKIKVLGATTLQESKNFLKDPALNRRFSEVICPELDPEDTEEIIRCIKGRYQKHHGVVLPDGMEKFLVKTADMNKKAGSHRPDNAITLLDTAMADLVITRGIQKKKASEEPDQATRQALLAALSAQPTLSQGQIEKSAKRLLDGKGKALSQDAFQNFSDLVDKKLIGQEEIKETVVDAIKRRTLGVFDDKKPLSFLLAGTTGCGKSHTGKLIAEGILGDPEAVININMTEFQSDMAITRLIGSTDGYVGSNSNHELPFDSLESNPRQVIILDEFEKASKGVQRLFMQALDEGVIKNARGKEIDFTKSIIIATTNAGQEELSKKSLGFGNEEKKPDLTDALSTSFDKELLGRFTHKLQFNSITKKIWKDILNLKFSELVEEVNNSGKYEILDAPGEELLESIADENFDEMLGARNAEKLARSFIEDKLLEANGVSINIFS